MREVKLGVDEIGNMDYSQIAIIMNGLTRLNNRMKENNKFESAKMEAKSKLGMRR